MPRRRGYDYDEWDAFPISQPIEVKDGIKAKTERGAFGKSWWAKRWIGILETFGWGNRLQRGRTYARKGQVISIDITPGQVQARVQGSRPTPYTVKLLIQSLTDSQWEQAIDQMAQQAIFSAKLLAGEMPQDIETAFESAGITLLPQSSKDIKATCSCPDAANPCKHIAAVYYLLGEQFDDDPFLIFQMRGRTRDQIITALRSRRAYTIAADDQDTAQSDTASVEASPGLADLLTSYFQAGVELDQISIEISPPPVEAALLKRLGTAPAATDAALCQIYQEMTARIQEKVFGA